jgi:hypothetical protein
VRIHQSLISGEIAAMRTGLSALAAVLGMVGAIGVAAAATPESLKACAETASRCRERCQSGTPCLAACQRSYKQCKLWESDTQPDHPRNSVMPR